MARKNPYTVRRAVSRTRIQELALAAFATLPLSSWAFGVGDVELRSMYAQPLSARVPITLTDAGEVIQPSDLAVRLLPQAAYEGMGLTPPPVPPEGISLEVAGEGQAFWVELRSRQPIREPVMTLLMEVRVSGVRIVRELPFLFDLPPAESASRVAAAPVAVAVPAPAVEPARQEAPATALPEVPVAAVSQPPVANPAPASLLPATVATEPAKPRVIIRRAPKKKSEEQTKDQRKTTFQLAEWNQTGLAPKVLLPRFQLAQSFDSYARLAQAGAAPAPATAVAQAAAPVPVTVPPVPEIRPVEAAPGESGGFGAAWWLLLTGFVAAVAMFLRRRGKPGKAQVVAGGQVVAVSEPVIVASTQSMAAVSPVVFRPAEAAQSEPIRAAEPAPVIEPVAVVEEPLNAPPSAASAPDIKKRLAELTTRVGSDASLLRKAQLVSAYIDLNRLESAESLLSELENEVSGAARPKFTLIKG